MRRWRARSGISGRNFPPWVEGLPDTRFQPFVIYDAKFFIWWGVLLFLCRLQSARQLDWRLRDKTSNVLENINALAGTSQRTLPVAKSLSHYLGHLGSEALASLRTLMVRALIRKRALDPFRLQGRLLVALDGTGQFSFRRRHCEHCLRQTKEDRTVYMHNVLEAKVVGSCGLSISIGSEFIDNRDHDGEDNKGKQDCELRAFTRLAEDLKKRFPQTALCLLGDSEFACGRVLQRCEQNGWKYVLTFKKGGLPSVWEDFQGLLKLCTSQVRRVEYPDGTREEFRWVNQVSYVDSEGREHTFDAIQCIQTKAGQRKVFAWITNFHVTWDNVISIAQQGGRDRWKIENEGFNTQKNGGYNLQHVYGKAQDLLRCYYLLLQIAHLMHQILEKGSLLKRLVRELGDSVLAVYGSLRNISRCLLECLLYFHLPRDALNPAFRVRVQFDTS